jgi:hypothetical protein
MSSKQFQNFAKKNCDLISAENALMRLLIITMNERKEIAKILNLVKTIKRKPSIKLIKKQKEIEDAIKEYEIKDKIFFEMMFVEYVNAFLNYLSDIYIEFFLQKPSLLQNTEISFYEVLGFRNNIEDLIRKKASDKAFSDLNNSFKEVNNKFFQKFKINLCREKKDIERIHVAKETRNLIVHFNGIVNKKFLINTKLEFNLDKKILISQKYLEKTYELLFKTAEHTDNEFIKIGLLKEKDSAKAEEKP